MTKRKRDSSLERVLNKILDEDSNSGSESKYDESVTEYYSDRESYVDVRKEKDNVVRSSDHQDGIVAKSGRWHVATQPRIPGRSVVNIEREQVGVTPAGVCHSPGEALKLLFTPDIMDVIVKHWNEEAVRLNVCLYRNPDTYGGK